MSHEAFLASIREAPEDPFRRAVFADWLDEQGQSIAAARLRWWNHMRPPLREATRVPELDVESDSRPDEDFVTPGNSLSSQDDWRWRLGCLAAIEAVERYFTPNLSPVTWEQGSPEGFRWQLAHSRFLIEMAALGAYGGHEVGVLQLAQSHAQRALDLGEGLKTTAAALGREGLLTWVDACEVQHMARRTYTVAQHWPAWVALLPSEGAMAEELMVASKAALEALLAEPLPDACL